MEDKKIINLFFDRSEKAIEELNLKYGRLCKQLAGNILNNPSDAEECVNDAYLGVWNSIPPEHPESLIAYVCRIVRNTSLKRYYHNTAAKRNSRFDVALDELEDCLASSTDIDDKIAENELTAAINDFLQTLKTLDRVIFIRRYYFSDSYADIASRVSISEKNVSVRLTRLKSRLKDFLTGKGFIV